jgi:hypothetical protein
VGERALACSGRWCVEGESVSTCFKSEGEEGRQSSGKVYKAVEFPEWSRQTQLTVPTMTSKRLLPESDVSVKKRPKRGTIAYEQQGYLDCLKHNAGFQVVSPSMERETGQSCLTQTAPFIVDELFRLFNTTSKPNLKESQLPFKLDRCHIFPEVNDPRDNDQHRMIQTPTQTLDLAFSKCLLPHQKHTITWMVDVETRPAYTFYYPGSLQIFPRLPPKKYGDYLWKPFNLHYTRRVIVKEKGFNPPNEPLKVSRCP